jgi:hypothetical protein
MNHITYDARNNPPLLIVSRKQIECLSGDDDSVQHLYTPVKSPIMRIIIDFRSGQANLVKSMKEKILDSGISYMNAISVMMIQRS